MMQSDTIHKADILEVLNRLCRYYGGRLRVARKLCVEATDEQIGQEHLTAVMRWQAKYEAVLTVARNLGLTIEEVERP